MTDVLSQQGLLIVQLAIFVVLVVSVVVFLVLWQRSRKETLREIQHTAATLAEQTAQVALALKEETDRRALDLRTHTEEVAMQVKHEAVLTAAELEHKIDTLLQRFDEVAVQQRTVKQVVEETKAVITRELQDGDDHTTRSVIEETAQTAKGIASQLDEQNGGKKQNGKRRG